MQNRPESAEPEVLDNVDPLRHLTPAQFMALGGNAVVYVRPIMGSALAGMMIGDDLETEAQFQLVVSADGSPLMVGDSEEAVADWLAERNYGVVSLH
ncbi:MAG: DUF1150 family protein [Devosia sp.]|nr:DUF1150 family protein [Devosia sp.]